MQQLIQRTEPGGMRSREISLPAISYFALNGQETVSVDYTLWIGVSLASCLMTWAKYRFLLVDHVYEIYGLIIAEVFVGLGIWMGLRLSRPKTIVKQECQE